MKTALTVRVIAPEVHNLPLLKWGTELGSLRDIEGVTVDWIGGPDVREGQIASALRAPCDVLIWSGHGTPAGMLLPRGKVVKSRWVASQAKAGAPRAFILAACGSGCATTGGDSMAWQIAKSGVNVIGFPEAVHDDAAIVYNTEFVRALVAGTDVGEAHDVALEAIEDAWPAEARSIQLLPGLSNGYRFIVERLACIEERLGRVETLLDARLPA